ncbi:MAG: FAD-binding oxidoreductase [Candidatus Krumholzibacteriia bacterium]
MSIPGQARESLPDGSGAAGPLTDAASLSVYARDASHLVLGRPAAVFLPAGEPEVRAIVRQAAREGRPLVCRGAGTGLSGGALPGDGWVVLGTSRLLGCGPVDPLGRTVTVEPGLLNERISALARPSGLHFAPDPSSQSAATIGGNIAENAGGPHCLRHGVTLQHLRRLRWCDARGEPAGTGRGLPLERGFDLVSLLCGSEGTLGIVTSADLKLTPDGRSVATMLAVFPRLDEAVSAVVTLLGSGLLPVAVEIVDQAMLEAVEKAFAFGFPTDVEAAMILEFSGAVEETAGDAARAEELLRRGGARDVQTAADEAERLALWRCRKKAFGAVGRLAPSYVTMDVVVPLGRLLVLVRDIQAIKARWGVEIATAFHAGDGNLHPGVHYDDSDPDQTRAAHAAADAIIARALELGGSVSGEHGIGIEKLHVLPWMLDRESARLHHEVKALFDPQGLLNPGKLLPAPGASFAPCPEPPGAVDFQWESLTARAPASARLADLQAAAMDRGLWIPLGAWLPRQAGRWGLATAGTVGEAVGDLVTGPVLGASGSVRDFLLELWAVTGDGRRFHTGAPVFKNVAGYDFTHALCGSGRVFVEVQAATFQLRPCPAHLGIWSLKTAGGATLDWPALEPLLRRLRERPNQPGPVCLVDLDAPGGGTLIVTAPGRDADWDLGALGRLVGECARRAGLECAAQAVVPFRDGPTELAARGLLPGWAAAGDDWDLLGLPAGAAEPGQNVLPDRLRRAVLQADPWLVWTPESVADPAPWFADAVCRGGRAAPLPRPAEDVPAAYLRGLKRIFDPDGRLDHPAWLKEG